MQTLDQALRALIRDEVQKALSEHMCSCEPPAPVLDPGDMVSSAEAGALLGVSVKTLANWRSSGSGPRFSKRGRVVRYQRAELEQWLTRE
ncbi:helix-turn-helix domain-containing protein [Curtobacterium sp. ISL-83]|uniref:helix-turn-helix domain-containing protein n=1 Tax=Curtobacterium sp. ISL-83 TaxID=2819145 RepID=UPI0027DFAC46|nr:helix-turn-helix domain-containing protein [Curtobacterium sp. ISL-83]